MKSSKAVIRAIASYPPNCRWTNDQLALAWVEWDAASILEKTGIAVRRLASTSQFASDLGMPDARKLFATGVCSLEDIDFFLFCTLSPDYFLPTTACTMQSRLGLRTGCGALDFNQGCS